MGERKIIGILVVVFALLLLGIDSGFRSGDALNVTDNATIMVNINTKTMIDISPENMSFGTLDPGTRSSNYTNSELGAGVSKTGFQLENIGSTNITNMWLNVTQPSIRPFGTGIKDNYDAANFVAAYINMSPDSSAIGQNTMSFVDLLEYNESRQLVYLNLPANTKSYGRLRSGYNEFFWALSTSGTNCNASASAVTLTIGTTPHNQTQTGTIDLANGADRDFVTLANMDNTGMNANWSYATVSDFITIDTPSASYCVTSYIDCSKVRFFRWNADAPGAGLCGLSGSGYTYNSTNTELVPGDSMAMNIELRIPFGIALGQIKSGYLTVIAQSAEGA